MAIIGPPRGISELRRALGAALKQARSFGMSRRDFLDAIGKEAPDAQSRRVRGTFGGFATGDEDLFWHGSRRPGFTRFDLPTSHKTRNTGIWMGKERGQAEGYADDRGEIQFLTQDDVIQQAISGGPWARRERFEVTPKHIRSTDPADQLLLPIPGLQRSPGRNVYDANYFWGDPERIKNANMTELRRFMDEQGIDSEGQKSGGVYPLFVRSKNPFSIDWEGRNWSDAPPESYQRWLAVDEYDSPYWGSTTDDYAREVFGKFPEATSVRFDDIEDWGDYPRSGDTTLVVRRPENIRHRDAMFALEPMFNLGHPDAANIMAGFGGGAIGLSALREALARQQRGTA